MYMAHVCFMSVVVAVWGYVKIFVVKRPSLKIVFFNLGVFKHVCVMDVVFSVCIVTCRAVGARVWEV